jgi:hypothetical protein
MKMRRVNNARRRARAKEILAEWWGAIFLAILIPAGVVCTFFPNTPVAKWILPPFTGLMLLAAPYLVGMVTGVFLYIYLRRLLWRFAWQVYRWKIAKVVIAKVVITCVAIIAGFLAGGATYRGITLWLHVPPPSVEEDDAE